MTTSKESLRRRLRGHEGYFGLGSQRYVFVTLMWLPDVDAVRLGWVPRSDGYGALFDLMETDGPNPKGKFIRHLSPAEADLIKPGIVGAVNKELDEMSAENERLIEEKQRRN